MFDLITIGDSTLDTFLILDHHTPGCRVDKSRRHLILNYGEKIGITHTAQSVGGNAANVAVGARRLGLKTSIVTELGDDVHGMVIYASIKKSGVGTSSIALIKGKETRYSVVLNFGSERTILSYHAPRSYTLPTLPKTKWIYYTSLGASFDRLQTQLLTYLHRHQDILLAFNPGSSQYSQASSPLREVLKRTDVLFVNKEEAAQIIHKKISIKQTCAALHRWGVKIITITDGENGSYASDGASFFSLPPYPIPAKAKTGAGDAYASGFLGALFYKKSIVEAMQWGTANAAGVIQQFGAQQGLLGKKGIEKMVRKFSKIKPTRIIT